MKNRICALLGLLALGAAPLPAAQMDIGVYNNLRRGMLESEVLLRAGAPDRVTSPDGAVLSGGDYLYTSHIRELHYLPDAGEHDPQLTVVTISRGRVSALERRKIIAPVAYPPADSVTATPSAARAPARSDTDIRRERAERTLEAAERYAEVRARIKQRDGEPQPPGRGGSVYRGTGEQGDAYFGDVPPPGSTGSEQ